MIGKIKDVFLTIWAVILFLRAFFVKWFLPLHYDTSETKPASPEPPTAPPAETPKTDASPPSPVLPMGPAPDLVAPVEEPIIPQPPAEERMARTTVSPRSYDSGDSRGQS